MMNIAIKTQAILKIFLKANIDIFRGRKLTFVSFQVDNSK